MRRDSTKPDPFPYLANRRGTNSLKWSRNTDADSLPMWIADMDFRCADPIVHALQKRTDHAVFGYAAPTQESTDAVIHWLQTRHNFSIQPEWIVWLPGLVPALFVMCRGFAKENESVLSFTPIYPPFMDAPVRSNRKLLTCPLGTENGRYKMDFEQLSRTVTPETRVLLLCNPHNPTGRVWNREELTQIAEFCLERKIVLCSDEIHCDLILDKNLKHTPTATLSAEIAHNTVTLMSPAKTFNLPGLNCGFAIIPNPTLRRTFTKNALGAIPHINALGHIACHAAYAKGGPWLEEVLTYLRENGRILYEAVNNDIPGLSMNLPEATYLAWIDIRTLNLGDPVAFFSEAGVIPTEGAAFGEPGFVRLNFACSREHLLTAIERIKKAVKETAT